MLYTSPYYNTEFPPGQGPGAEITSQSLRDELELDGPRVPGAPGAPGAGAPRAGAPRPDAPYGPFGAARRPSGAPGTAGAAGGVAARPPGVLGPFGAAGPAGAAGSAGDNWRSRGGNTGGREGGGNNRSDRGDWRTGNWRTGGQGGGGGGDGASATVALAVSSFGSDSESEESAYNGSPSWGPAGRPSWYSPVMRQGLGGRDEVNWRDAADALQDDIAEQMRAEDKLAGTKRRRAGDLEAMLSALDSARKRRR
ncbi:hypothetical protein F4677DRAFT_140833 [Hypoxylon crocopeplum]|nr:hypothetical protein F4677DRAFT_140833 [Hypoxylon crocopeplum]